MWKALNCLSCSGCEGEQWKKSLERGPDPTAAGGDREPSSTALTQSLVGLFVWSRRSLLGLFSALLCISWAWSRTGVMLSWEPSPGLGAAAVISSQWFFPGRQSRMCNVIPASLRSCSLKPLVSSIILSFYIASQVETWATTEGKWEEAGGSN